MKLFVIKVFVVCIRVLYAPMKLVKTRNKILYLSRQSNEKSADYEMLSRCISNIDSSIKQVFRLRRLKDESGLSLSYVFSVLGDMMELATAKVVITDTYSIPVSCLNHKNGTEIVQLWHAIGAVKKFSLQAVGKAQGRDSKVSEAMCMHKNYTRVLAPSRKTAEVYCEAFGCDDSVIELLNLPRVDVILNGENKRAEFLSENPQYKNKKLVAYIPTFRNNEGEYAKKLFQIFENDGEYALVVSPHPLSDTAKSGKYAVNGNFDSLDIMKLADIVISDYSACSFEAALLAKPLYFFIPDYDIYKCEQGLNFDMMSEMPQICFYDGEKLLKCIKTINYDFDMLSQFADKYVEYKNTNNTERLAEFICSLLDER